jgi:hypothetical protein
MTKHVNTYEDFCFANTNELVSFLEEEWSYEQKDIDFLLKEQYDCYGSADAHESTTTIVELTPDNSGGFTQWYLSVKTEGTEYDNYG